MPASLCKLRLHLVYHYVLSTAKVGIVFEMAKENQLFSRYIEIFL